MRAIISRAKRCLSLLLAVLLVVPAMSLSAFAAEHEHAEGMLLSQVIVANYENLPAAEKTIINSGVLKGDQAVAEHYPALPDDLVELGDGKTVIASASSANGYTWKPGNTALLYVDGALQEQITLTNGEGTYKYNGSAFEIQVTYELHKELTDNEMEASLALLNVAYNLNKDIVNFKTLTAKDITLGGSKMSVVDVLGALTNPSYGMLLGVDGTIVDLIGTMAEGIKYEADGTFIEYDINIGLAGAAKAAAKALSEEQAAGGLLLARFFAEHSGMSALEMIAEHGEELNAAIKGNYDTLVALNNNYVGLPKVRTALDELVNWTLPNAMESLYADLNDQLDSFKVVITDENLAAQLPESIEDTDDLQQLVEVLKAQRNSLLNMVNNKLENTDYTGGAITGSDDVGKVADWLEEGTQEALGKYGYNSIDAAIADLNDKIAAGEDALEAAYAERDALLAEYDYASVDEAIADLEAKMEEAEGQLDGLNTAVTNLENAITMAEKYGQDTTQLKAQLAQAQAAVTLCEQAIAQADALKTQLNTAKENLADAEAALAEAKSVKRELESLKSLVQYVQDAQDGLADLEAAIENLTLLQEKIVEADATMTTLETYLNGVTTLISVVEKLIAGLQPAYDYCDSWTVNDQIDLSALADAAKSTQYTILTEAASRSGVTYKEYDISDVENSVYLVSDVTGCSRSMSEVTVTVKLEVVNAANVTVTSTYTGKVSLTDGTNAAGIKAAIESIEATALAQWSDYDAEHYEITSDELDVPVVLDGPVSFEITYSPKKCEVNFVGAVNSYPYGWNITLPEHEDPEKAYDYVVNSEKYMQGATVTVDGNINITRTEGDAYVRETLLNAMTAELGHAGLAAVLNSDGVHGVYEKYFYVRYPKETVSYDASTHVVTAENYASDYENTQWVPVSANLCTEDHTVVDTVEFNGGNTVEVTYNGDYDYIDVTYELDLGMDTDEVYETLSGVTEIYNDAVVQLTRMDSLVEYMAENIGLMNIAIGIVEDNGGPEALAALAELNAKCKPAEGGDYYIVTHLNNYSGNSEPNGLWYYYLNAEGETGIINSLANMVDPLKVVIKDQCIEDLLDLTNGAYTVDDLDDIVKSFEDLANALKEAAPSKTIKDPKAVAYAMGNPKTMPEPALETVTLNADGKLTLKTNVSAPVDVTMKSVNIAVTVLDAYDAGVPVNTTAVYVAEGYPLSDAQIEALVAAAAELSPQGDDLEIYAANIDDLTAYLEGLTITANTTVTYKWTLTCTHAVWEDATCVSPATCTRCGLTDGGVDPDAHSWGGWSVIEDATCTEHGSKTRSCSLCGETENAVITAPGHKYGAYSSNNDATCEEDGTKTRSCSVCGGLDTVVDVGSALGHSYGDWIDSGSDEEHIRYCDNLNCTKFETTGHDWDNGVVTVESTCTKHGVITYTCADCGATKTKEAPLAEHTYKYAVTADEAGHILTCTACGATSGVVQNHAWNTNDCETAGYCTVCNKVKAKGEHHFEWSYTEHEHTQTCSTESCGKTVTAAHNWVPGDTKEPTCVEDGYALYSCLCGATKTDVIPATGEHSWDNGKVTTKPTCTEDGVRTFTCEICGETKTEPVATAGQHNMGAWEQTVAPSCTEKGEERRDCDQCDYYETRELDVIVHSWDNGVVTTKPTCTEDGVKTYTCSVCGETKTETEPAAGAHSWDNGVVTTKPTCTESGVKTYTCIANDCGETKTEVIPATGHSFAAGWTADVTGHWHVCENDDCQETSGFAAHVYPDGTPCDAVGVKCTVCERATEVGEGSHSMSAWTQTAAPSCTEKGEERRDCANCDYFETREIEALGHAWDNGVETVAPDCETEGEMTYTCTECGETRTEAIPATGHTEETVPGYPATCTEPGLTDGKVCLVCQKVLVEQVEIPAADHTWGNGVVTVAPTKFAAGVMTYTCSECGETKTEVIPALGVEDEIEVNVGVRDKEIVLPGDDGSAQYDIKYVITLTYNGRSVTIERTVATVEGETLNLRDYVNIWVSNGTFASTALANNFIAGLSAQNVTVETEIVDAYANKLETFVSTLNEAAGVLDFTLIQNADGTHAIVANVTNAKGVAGALMKLINALSVYGYIGMADSEGQYQPFYYDVELSLQALIDGLLAEDGFGTERILEIVDANGKIIPTTDLVGAGATMKGSGKIGGLLQTINIALGSSPTDTPEHTLPLHLTLTDTSLISSDIRGALASIRPYLTIDTVDGKLNANLTLPEKIYEGYLAVGLLTGVENKGDADSVLSEEAFNYIYDYIVDATEGVTVDTYENTAAKLGYGLDLTGTYESIANYLISVLSEGVAVTENDRVFLTQSVSKSCKTILDKLLGTVGFALPEQVLGMIVEYQNGDDLSIDLQAQLTSDEVEFDVAVIDIQNGSTLDKIDFAENGAARINAMQGTGAVMLLDDITGNLVFNNTTILDLNGKTVTGNIKANASLIIVDSSMDTYLCGGVDGKIEGNVTIIAGNYTADVTKFLAEGHVQKDGTVRNAMYYVAQSSTMARAAKENVTIVINSDYIDEIDGYLPSVRELAVDIATDLVLNYITAAAFSVDGKSVTAINLTDLIDLISGGDRVEKIADELLGCVDVDDGVAYLINALFADLLNFEGIAYAIENDTAIATHTVTTRPWLVAVKRVANGDYITADLTYNTDDSLKKEFDLSLVIDGQNVKTVALPLFKELAEIVDANETEVTVALDQPIYDDQIVSVGGTLSANVVADLTKGIEAGDYATVIGVILAYGNTAKRAAVADAINTGNMIALKEVFDNTSVKELFTALKAMSKDVSFSAMATKVGVTANIGITGNLEKVYRYVLAGTGKVLEKLEITGMDSKLGGLYDAQTGYYELSKAASRDGNYTHSSGYGVDYDLTLNTSGLKVKIFPETSGNWTVTVYGNKGTHFTSNKGDWDYGDNEIVITLEADEELTFEYWVAANRTLTSFKINGENVRSKYPANKTHTISAADFGSEVEIYIASTPTIVPSTKVICECGDPDCTCKTECHSVEYEDLAAILAENPNVWWHLDGHRYLDYVICKGLMIGTSTDPLLFEPGMLMSRSMIVTALYHLEGDPEVTGKATDFYTDVLDGQWYSDAIVWATNEGLVFGYGNDKFGASDVLTREQLATLFYRFTEYKGKDVDYNGSLDLSDSFTDAGDISIWALTGVEWAYDRGLISGPGNNMLMPKGDISRCEFAALLCHWIWGEYDD